MGIKERRLREKLRRSQEIVDAAESVFFQKGIQHATMDDIAKEAELGKATLYVYYKSKDEILLEIKKRAMYALAREFRLAVEAHEKGMDKVRAIGRAYLNFAREYPNYYAFISLFEAVNMNIDDQDMAPEFDEVSQVLKEAIEVGIADGSIRDDLRPVVVGKVLWAVSTGILQMINMKKEMLERQFDIKEEEMFACFFALLDRGMEN